MIHSNVCCGAGGGCGASVMRSYERCCTSWTLIKTAYRVPKPAFCGSDDLGELRFTSCGVQHTETAYGSYGMVSIDWPSQCSTSLLLKRKPRSSVIQFSADSRGNWPCHLPILQSQPEHTVGVSRIRATQ